MNILKSVTVKAVVAENVTEPINGRSFMIANQGAQPLYINPSAAATSSNGFLVPANTVLDKVFTVTGNLNMISNATGTTAAIMYIE